ncbi:ABC transporter substrate-binding protein [Inhella gelatinilytica]|uniref:ABC transporter substrate-binding protein n=1 Tax=Inhella gelatinilytica TaxID=2795030 RepID=A0A931IZY2_9BURK|nr:ABC transporter substrate-binding protein [Inhella gelatinilytica]MBH9553028.1 ABC transporter substrate-binding protein [Inhella gelatinilytica]
MALHRRHWLLTASALAWHAQAAEPGIVLGASAALSGPARLLGQRYHVGSEAALRAANLSGGIHGRAVQLLRLDDAYEADRAVANTEALVQNPQVVGLLGYIGTPTSMAALPVVKRHGMAFVGPFTGADALWERSTPQVFNVRASYRDEAKTLAQAMRVDGCKTLGVLYQADLFGRAGLEAMREALQAQPGPRLSALATVKRNTVEVAAAVELLVRAEPLDALFMVSTYGSCAAFIQAARAAGFAGRFYTLSFVGLEPLRDALGGAMHGVSVSQVVPDPDDARLPVAAAYQAALRAHGDGGADSISFEGFLSTQVMLTALKRATRPLDRRALLQALEGLGMLDLAGFTVDYRPGRRRGSSLVRVVRA